MSERERERESVCVCVCMCVCVCDAPLEAMRDTISAAYHCIYIDAVGGRAQVVHNHCISESWV